MGWKLSGITDIYLYLIVLILGSLNSCKKFPGNSSGQELFASLPTSVTGVEFSNQLDYKRQMESRFNIYTFRNFYNGAGVAIGDINNDDLPDIFFASNMGSNKLYLNKGNFKFEDISDRAGIGGSGWSTGVTIADVNGDGLRDIYVCKSGSISGSQSCNELFINNGDLTFTESAAKYGLNEHGNSTQGIFFDYDKDGDMDLFLLKNFPKAIGSFNLKDNQRLKRDTVGGTRLYRNDGGKFRDVSAEAGIYGSVIAFGLGVCAGDIDMDGWMDIYVSNDFFERDYLYLNNHDGTFREVLTDKMKSISAASMGGDMADINNDLHPDIFTTDMLPETNERIKTKTTFDSWENYKFNADNGYYHQFTRNMLQLNNGDGTFSEIGRLAGTSATDWSWGALICDFDNDRLKDIFVANGIYKDLTDQDYIQYFSNRDMVMSIISGKKVDFKRLIDAIPSVPLSNYMFHNLGNLHFSNSAQSWGLGTPGFSNGAAYGDLDNDGDPDLVINNVNMPASIFRNEAAGKSNANHYLKIKLTGSKGNIDAVGAKVFAVHYGQKLYLEQMPMRGYLSTVDSRLLLGLGTWTTIDTLLVQWPDDRITLLRDVKPDQYLKLDQKDGVSGSNPYISPFVQQNKYFRDITDLLKIDYSHTESDFNDFLRDPLLIQMLSTEGPRMCKGDINGDGLDDVYVCGGKNQSGALLLQQKNGSFIRTCRELFEQDKISNETDCAIFDANNDGLNDLYVACGGNEFPSSSSALNNRLYINDGKGGFHKTQQILPAGKYESTSCVRPCDFDKDGITELFIGARLKPFGYGIPVNGYLLENDGKGHLTDVTSRLAPGLNRIGMIRDMIWCDVDSDGDQDIIIAGDWMPLVVFINDNGSFRQLKDAFPGGKTNGWWSCLAAGDFNGDGHIDFIAGNHGLNSRFKADPEKPVTMYVSDFDNNGAVEQVVCQYSGGKSYPIALKHDLIARVPNLAAKFPTYESYKDKQIQDIFSEEQLKSSVRLEADLLETSLFLNDGTGHFSKAALPEEIQYSPVYSLLATDIDSDGKPDILAGGNLYSVKPEVGRYDASFGSVLEGDGKGGFKNIQAGISGFRLDGEVRNILEVKTAAGRKILVAKSNGPLQVFEFMNH